MFPNQPPKQQLSKAERQLCKAYKKLTDNKRQTLLSFAEFLLSEKNTSEKIDEKKTSLQQPVLTQAIENESVVKGIKRLRASYFMIDDENLFHEVSALMSEHIMKGVSAKEAILKIEVVFEKFYQQYKKDFINNNN